MPVGPCGLKQDFNDMADEQKDLKTGVAVEEAPDESDHSSKEETEEETAEETEESEESLETEETSEESESEGETVESLKEKLKKAETDRDNYRKGLLSQKAKDRSLTDSQQEESKENVDVSAEVVRRELDAREEKKAWREVLNPDSSHYLPELLDDVQYKEIIAYLPRNVDRSSVDGIAKALRIAVNSWKIDRGMPLSPAKKKSPKAQLSDVSSETLEGRREVRKQRKSIIPKKETVDDWYK